MTRRSARGRGAGRGGPGLGVALGGPRGLLTAALLALAGLVLARTCIRVTMMQSVPTNPTPLKIAPNAPAVVLDRASDALVRQHGILDAATLNAVKRAAAAAPLDARAFLILGHQQLLDAQPRRAVATLEAGQRLNPRQRLIHLLLLDRYLRTNRYADAATQFSVLARLIGQTQAPIADAMAQMALAPDTRAAVRRTLATDPRLERAVLTSLAKSDTPPLAIFALASPAALAQAGEAEGWGPTLVARLVARGRFVTARAVWSRVYRLPPAETAAPVFNAGLTSSPASPPFNWTTAGGELGAADLRNGGMTVDYYGRDSGDFASQLLVLGPGRYRFSFIVEPGKTDAAARLIWTIACATGTKAALVNANVVAAAARRRLVADFAVPPGCPAQALTLRGEAGEFPVPASVTIRQPDIRPLPTGGGR